MERRDFDGKATASHAVANSAALAHRTMKKQKRGTAIGTLATETNKTIKRDSDTLRFISGVLLPDTTLTDATMKQTGWHESI
jgi:hypothetical protein